MVKQRKQSDANLRQLQHLHETVTPLMPRSPRGHFIAGFRDLSIPRASWGGEMNKCPKCDNLKLKFSHLCRVCVNVARCDKSRRVVNGYVVGEGRVTAKVGKRTRAKAVHITIAEKALGRSLKTNEHVHHINMDKTDNRNCNLLICDRSYHAWIHWAYAKKFAEKLNAS